MAAIPVYKLQITDLNGALVASRYGQEKLEVEIINTVLDKLTGKVGLFTSEDAVKQAVAQAIDDTFFQLKEKSRLSYGKHVTVS